MMIKKVREQDMSPYVPRHRTTEELVKDRRFAVRARTLAQLGAFIGRMTGLYDCREFVSNVTRGIAELNAELKRRGIG